MDGVGGLLVLLQEDGLKEEALHGLHDVVDSNWAEILNQSTLIEDLAEKPGNSNLSELAASVLSHCLYHSEQYDLALFYALRSGHYFNIESENEYEVTIVGKCIEVYITLERRKKLKQIEQILLQNQAETETQADANSTKTMKKKLLKNKKHEVKELKEEIMSSDELVDWFGEDGNDLQYIIDLLFKKCIVKKSFKEALGISLEANNVDRMLSVLHETGPKLNEMLSFCLDAALNIVKTKYFKEEVLEALVSLYEQQMQEHNLVNYLELFICLHALNKVDRFAKILESLLLNNSETDYLITYQAAFDLLDIQDQKFVSDLLGKLPRSIENEELAHRLKILRAILSEDIGKEVNVDFLRSHNATDINIFKKIKAIFGTVRGSNSISVLRNAALVSHAFMQSGTTNDGWLNGNEGIEFAKPSINWARFSATACYGVIHKGNTRKSASVLENFLPKGNFGDASKGGPYAEGGSLYALGLIHSCEGTYKRTGKKAINFLYTVLKDSGQFRATSLAGQNPSASLSNSADPLQHGACLGLGLVALASGKDVQVNRLDYSRFKDEAENESEQVLVDDEFTERHNLIDILMDIIKEDDAVPGEAAALAIGMVCFGQYQAESSEDFYKDLIARLLNIARDGTKHEKIIRALGMSIAMILYNQQEKSEHWVTVLINEKDSLLRYGGMYAMGLSYIATGDAACLKRLLKIAVSDVNNDVRRAAVTNLGFVCLNLPEKIPQLIELLSESFNPFVRYGAAMALGVGCSGMKNPQEALDLLSILSEDKTDFVRQGAMISTSILLMQRNPDMDKAAKDFKEKTISVAESNKVSSMARFGAMLSLGIFEAAGRNCNIEMIGKGGVAKPPTVLGMVMFLQYWYWYPLMHFLSLSFSPTSLIGLDRNLNLVDNFSVECDYEKLIEFDYPKKAEEKKQETKVKIETAVLSMTAKAKAQKKMSVTGTSGMELDLDKAETEKEKNKNKEVEMKDLSNVKSSDTEAKGKDEKGTESENLVVSEDRRREMLSNPMRVTRKQRDYIVFLSEKDKDVRYVPVAIDNQHKTGIVVLKDLKPKEPEASGDKVISYYKELKSSKKQTEKKVTSMETDKGEDEVEIPDSFVFKTRDTE